MALEMGALRDALLAAGAGEEKASKAAAEAAGYESRIAGLESRVGTLTWMTGTNLAMTLAVLWRVFTH